MYQVHDCPANGGTRLMRNEIQITQQHLNAGNTATIHATNFTTHNSNYIYVAKLYRQKGDYFTTHYAAIEQKLQYMVRNKVTYLQPRIRRDGNTVTYLTPNIAWPEYLLYTESDTKPMLVGFLMKYIDAGHTVESYIEHRLPQQDRNRQDRNRWLLAYSIARYLAELHDAGMYIGDLHPGNLLATQRNTQLFDIHFIDCDSYTIHDGNQIRHASSLQPNGCFMLHKNPKTTTHIHDNELHAAAHILFQLIVGFNPYKAQNFRVQEEQLLYERTFPCTSKTYPAHPQICAQFLQLPVPLQELFIQAFSTNIMPALPAFRQAIFNSCKHILI
jgi:DNA-binding helix-hairpin-helix protein with protein kinase domain